MNHDIPLKRRLCAAIAVAGVAAIAAPAFAQEVGEITVMGRMGPDGRPESLSRIVSIADLDLRSDADVEVMRSRIRDTARDVCTELGESETRGAIPTCRDVAVRDAMDQARIAIAQARAPTYAYVIPPAEPYVASAGEAGTPASAEVADVADAAPSATYTTTTVTNGPVPDTPENRARLGGPMSNGGRNTAPAGN